jgi:predicted nucleotidyltransferase
MKPTILENLDRIERENNVRILFAVESGSRAWGFASRDSDFDVRFIYLHPLEWYLSIREQRDVIEVPISDSLDISGWDLRKTLGLIRKSNPPLFEWLGSPIVYMDRFGLSERLRGMMREFVSPRQCIYHYLHTARNNYKRYLTDDTVKLKKYFYVLRPLLGCAWVEKHNTMPPTEFARLYKDAGLAPDLTEEIDGLLARKMAGDELDKEPRIEVLNRFLEERIAWYSEFVEGMPRTEVEIDRLDGLFREMLRDVWGAP